LHRQNHCFLVLYLLLGITLRNAGLGDSTIGDTNLRNANLEGCSGEISMINVELTGAVGFRPSIVFAGYRKLTLPDGRFIADWQTEEI
jgi:uncharacterized protein YjbI with pentapeptide repeats